MNASGTRTTPRTAFVIGGSGGIGRAVTCLLAARGVACAIGYQTNDVEARRTAAQASSGGRDVALVRGDVAVDAGRMVTEAADRLGGLDCLVVTPAPKILGRISKVTYDDYRQVMDAVAWGFLDAVQTALPFLEQRNGSALAVSSLGAHYYTSYYGALGPAKAALENLVRYLAAETGRRGVRVNAIAPSLVEDTLDEASPGFDQELVPAVTRRTPLRRLATTDDVAAVAVALAGSDFSMVTGQVVTVDGGYSLLA